MKWDESKHPRKPAGTPEGGEFTTVQVTGMVDHAKLERLRALHSGQRVAQGTFKLAKQDARLFVKAVNETDTRGVFAKIVPEHMKVK